MPEKYFTARKLVTAVALTVAVSVGIYSCHSNQSQIQEPIGKTLAKKYCTSCHAFADPSLADKKSWQDGILPAMAKNLKLRTYMGQIFADSHSVVSSAEWGEITKWYITNAPDSLVIPKPKVAPVKDWAVFSVVRPQDVNRQMPAMTTMTAFSPIDHQLYTSDAANNLYRWTPDGKSTLLHTFESPVTGADFKPGGLAVLTTIGNMIPLDSLKGKIQEYNLGGSGKSEPVVITDSLPRPVQTVSADFNKDGLEDYVVCGFGHDRGALYYVQQLPGKKVKKQVMLGVPGGVQLQAGDFNNDGWTDVICLFAQADESLRMFLNDHHGGFTMKTLLQFPPIYGSGSFQLVDFDKDGKLDILYAAGDNSDFSKVLKPYHGVYIFTNQGNWRFKQTYFYHIDGCTKAMAADFDGDGDLDIAAIGFFSDFKYHPEEGFTYLEQKSAGNYQPHYVPVQTYGRWIAMDIGDIDLDGDPDIVLGNFSIGDQRGLLNQKGFTPQWDMNEPIIILKNKTKGK